MDNKICQYALSYEASAWSLRGILSDVAEGGVKLVCNIGECGGPLIILEIGHIGREEA